MKFFMRFICSFGDFYCKTFLKIPTTTNASAIGFGLVWVCMKLLLLVSDIFFANNVLRLLKSNKNHNIVLISIDWKSKNVLWLQHHPTTTHKADAVISTEKCIWKREEV